MNYRNPELRKRLADEYVLGTLHGAARARFEGLLRDDAALRMLVDQSSAKWNNLVELVPPIAPPAHVWKYICQRTQPIETATQSTGTWWSAIGFWQGWAALATVVALFFAWNTSQWQQAPTTRFSNYLVVITDDAESRASWMLSANEALTQLNVKAIQPQPIPDDRVFQLWIKVKNESKVRPVGLIPASGEGTIALDKSLQHILTAAEKFGVSIEPPGGSPTGQPTTTPLYHGNVLSL